MSNTQNSSSPKKRETREMVVLGRETIESAAKEFKKGEDNIFKRCLNEAKELREAGLTPVFLATTDNQMLIITTAERIQGRLH